VLCGCGGWLRYRRSSVKWRRDDLLFADCGFDVFEVVGGADFLLGGETPIDGRFDISCSHIQAFGVENVRERLREKIGEFDPDEARAEPTHD